MIKYALNAWLADGLGDTYIDDYYLDNPQKAQFAIKRVWMLYLDYYWTDLKHYFPDYVEKVVRAPQPTFSRTNSIGNGLSPSRPNGKSSLSTNPQIDFTIQVVLLLNLPQVGRVVPECTAGAVGMMEIGQSGHHGHRILILAIQKWQYRMVKLTLEDNNSIQIKITKCRIQESG